MKIIIIIPAFNEEKNIFKVIKSLKNENSDWDILVINDCSNDNTFKIAMDTKDAFVISLPCNLGIGGSVQTGFKFAKISFTNDPQTGSTPRCSYKICRR